MPRAQKGVLVECDPSIKAILLKLDNDSGHAFIQQDLDDSTLVIKESRLAELKLKLNQVLEKAQMHDREEQGSDDDD
ncbi:nucleotide excision repair, TFIIH, subunit, partial [Ascodesmis nigricans]